MDSAKKILKSGTLITASEMIRADLLIQDDKIEAIGVDLPQDDCQVFDVSGRFILPGGVDPHTHLDLPMFGTVSSDDHYTGHKAAAFGGTTTVIDFIPQDFPSLHEAVDAWHAKADAKAAIDFAFHMNITSLDAGIENQIPTLLTEGITSLKVFMAYNGRLRLQDGEIFKVMRIGAEQGMLTLLHAENGDVIEILTQEALRAGLTTPEWHAHTRPAWGAVESVLRGIGLAEQAGSPLYIVHVNTAGGLDQIRYARDRALPIMGETCPQYLFFNIEHLRREDGAKWICSPPLRTEEDNHALWDGLGAGVFQTVGTDHCPFFYDGTQAIEYEGQQVMIPGKELGKDDFTKIPNGLPGVGDRLPVLWSTGVGMGRISMNQFVALTSTNPAKIFGLYPKKGALQPGSDADLVIWDPARELTYGVAYAHHRTDYNLYEGWQLKGFPEKVFLRGQLIVDGDTWHGCAGMGQFIRRQPNAEVI
ncbi:MAG: dihydropyrimidinase [Anaerolineales bacterium]|nr:MAG: dihydropyrimidinase [Anaerolineales bacterium]